jgi:hypothetical protein
MDQATKFDPRLAPLTQRVKSMARPQSLYSDKAGTVRAERVNGIRESWAMAGRAEASATTIH